MNSFKRARQMLKTHLLMTSLIIGLATPFISLANIKQIGTTVNPELSSPSLAEADGFRQMKQVLNELLKYENLNGHLRTIIKRTLDSNDIQFIELTPEIRDRLKLDSQFKGATYGNDYLAVRKDQSNGDGELLNDGIQDDNSGLLDRSRIAVLAPDLPIFTTPQSKAWGLQIYTHELAHADFNRLLKRVSEKLSNVIPKDFMRIEGSIILLHPELFDLLHEWYAYRYGFMFMNAYYQSIGLRPATPVVFNHPSLLVYIDSTGDDRALEHNEEAVKQIVTTVYGVKEPAIINLMKENILEKILALDNL